MYYVEVKLYGDYGSEYTECILKGVVDPTPIFDNVRCLYGDGGSKGHISAYRKEKEASELLISELKDAGYTKLKTKEFYIGD